MTFYNEFEVYIPTLSSVSLADTEMVGGVLHYYYFITYSMTPVSTQILDTGEVGTDVDLTWTYKAGTTVVGGEGFNSATNEQTSMTFYVDTVGGGYIKLQTHNVRADTLDSLGDFETSYVYLAPEAPTLTAEYTHYLNEASYRKISANANTLSADFLNTKMKLTAHYYNTPGDEEILELGEIEPDSSQTFVFKDYNNYNSSHLYYTAVVTQYNKKGDQEYVFASDEASITLSPYIQPYPAVIYGPRAKNGDLICVMNEGLHLDWTFLSRDGSEQQSYSVTLTNSLNVDLVTKTGGQEQFCDFTTAEIGGPDTSETLKITLETYGLSSDAAVTTDYVFCAFDAEATASYTYEYANQLIRAEIGNAYGNDKLDLTAYIAIKDLQGNILYSDISSVFDANSRAKFAISINDIQDYTATETYVVEYSMFSNILQGYVDSAEEEMTPPGYSPPTAPVVDVTIIDDYCSVDVSVDNNTSFIDIICLCGDKTFYIAKRAQVTDSTEQYRFNTPPIGVDFNIYAIAYDNFYTPSDESNSVACFVQCDSNVYVNYMSATDTEHSRYTEKFAVRVNAEFSESVANNLEQYSVIGKYDKVTQLDGNASREMSLAGDIAYRHGDIQLFETFAITAQKCVVRIPKSGVFYCYVSSADVEKTAGARNAKVNIKLLIDSSIAAEQTVTYDRYAAMVAYAEQVLSELL